MLCPKRGTSDRDIFKDGHVGLIANFSACCSSPLASEYERHHGSICSSCPHWLLKAIGSTSPVVLWFSYTSPVVLPSEYENDQCARRRISNPIKAGIQHINPPHTDTLHSFITAQIHKYKDKYTNTKSNTLTSLIPVTLVNNSPQQLVLFPGGKIFTQVRSFFFTIIRIIS